MKSEITFNPATPADARAISEMVGELLAEISASIGVEAFNFELRETQFRLTNWLQEDRYFAFIANQRERGAVGFVTLCEVRALYAEGAFGVIPELYVRSGHRSQGLGKRLLEQARGFARERGWKRLEVTTPPLPEFDASLAFYLREGFSVTGGRKLKLTL